MHNQSATNISYQALFEGGGVATIFQGFDTFTGKAAVKIAVEGKKVSINPHSELSYTQCETTESVTKAMRIDASVGVVYGPASVDVKTEFVKELNLTSYSLTLLVKCFNVTGIETGTDLALRPGIDTKDPDEFFQSYGDSFVNEVEIGAFSVLHMSSSLKRKRNVRS